MWASAAGRSRSVKVVLTTEEGLCSAPTRARCGKLCGYRDSGGSARLRGRSTAQRSRSRHHTKVRAHPPTPAHTHLETRSRRRDSPICNPSSLRPPATAFTPRATTATYPHYRTRRTHRDVQWNSNVPRRTRGAQKERGRFDFALFALRCIFSSNFSVRI